MKHFISVLLVLFMLLGLTSCFSGGNGVEWTTDMTEDEFFDRKQKHKPTVEELKQVEKGMSFAEVVSIIGKPHGYGNTALTFSWTSQEGKTYDIFVLYTEQYAKDYPDRMKGFERYYLYGVAESPPYDFTN